MMTATGLFANSNGHGRKAIIVAFGVAVFDYDIAAYREALFLKP